MPAPEVNVAETFEYLLKKNAELHQMRFALGAEEAIYLVGEVPVSAVTEDDSTGSWARHWATSRPSFPRPWPSVSPAVTDGGGSDFLDF